MAKLSEEEVHKLTKSLKAKYEELTSERRSDEEMRQLLTEVYWDTIKSFPDKDNSQKVDKPIPRFMMPLQRNKSKRGTRRRSFDPNHAKKKPMVSQSEAQLKVMEETASIPQAVSIDVFDAEPDEVVEGDHWESITHQPFCTLCNMAFKSSVFLERHVKYSDIHSKNVKRANGELVDEVKVEPAEQQIDGVHYKLIYSGEKLFWKINSSVHVDIYIHIHPNILEIVPYDYELQNELKRIYVSYDTIVRILEESGRIEEGTDEIAENMRKDKFATINKDQIRKELKHKMTITYCMQRLQPEMTNETLNMKFVRLHDDENRESPIVENLPKTLVPVQIMRRKFSKATDMHTEIKNLSAATAAVSEDSDRALRYLMQGEKASKIAGIVQGAALFISERKWWHKLNLPRRRFIFAAKRVIRQRNVEKTKEVLSTRRKGNTAAAALLAAMDSLNM